MDPLDARIDRLSPAKRRLLEARLKKSGMLALPCAVERRAWDDAEPVPLSFPQRRLWFLDKLEPGLTAYNRGVRIELRGTLDEPALRRALNEILRRHESLRTRFDERDGEPVAEVMAPRAIELPVEDLSSLPTEQCEAACGQRAKAVVLEPFDLRTAPLVRVRLLRINAVRHDLVWASHHIVSDAWSRGVLVWELSALYEAYASGRQSPLPELRAQYRDHAAWQQQRLRGAELEKQLRWWRAHLGERPAVLELPTDRPRPRVQTHAGAKASIKLPSEVVSQLKAVGRERGATLFMAMFAAVSAVLGRWAHQDQVILGTPIAGRRRIETEAMIGLFINTLAIRADLSGEPTFAELIERVKQAAVGAYTHQDLPFEKLVDELKIERNLGRTPLFSVMLNYHNVPAARQRAGAAQMRFQSVQTDQSQFDLTLYLEDVNDGGLAVTASYNRDLFDEPTMRRLLRRLTTLVRAAAAEPGRRVSTLPLLDESERAEHSRRRNTVEPTNAYIEFERQAIEQSIVSRFEQIAARHADRPAVVAPTRRWTYRELNDRAEEVARQVRAAMGAKGGAGGRAALLLGHEAVMASGVLGVMKAGLAYVPLDPSYPVDRLRLLVEDAQVSVVVSDLPRAALAHAAAGSRTVVVTDEKKNASPPSGGCELSSADAAYIIYTSGSTGRPKGVVQNHRNVLHHMRTYTNALHIAAEDRVLMVASYASDAGMMDIFGALLNGAALCPIDIKTAGAEGLIKWIEREQVTIAHWTPTVYRWTLGSVVDARALASVRLVVMGGEAVGSRDVELYRRWFGRACLFVNGMGPTESTMAMQQFIHQDTVLPRGVVPIGYAVADTQMMLVSETGEACELVGEIAVRSEHVALGYWRRDDLTAKAFTGMDDGSPRRVYRTGDLGRMLDNGSIEYLGRIDHQLKVRGFRIEPGEIEAALYEHAAVHQCVVVADGEGPDKRLAAYVTFKDGIQPTPDALRTHVAGRLPRYMVPAMFMLLDKLPLTPNGKVDRKALPAPRARPARESGYVAPDTETEDRLAAIWSEVLNVDRVGRHDDFFALGGHSLQAIIMTSKIVEAFDVQVHVLQVFDTPAIRDLAALIDEKRGILTAPELDRVSPSFVSFTKEDLSQSIPARFERQAGAHPDRLAVQTQRHRYTYDALNRAANRVARAIRTRCGASERPAAVLLDHDAPMIVAILGVLKAGRPYVPLDTSHPHARNATIFEHVQADVIITDRQHHDMTRKLTGNANAIIDVDQITLDVTDENPGLSISPDSPAYIIYTSGSTGRPKGVVDTHRNVLHNVMRYTNSLRIGAEDRLTLLQRASNSGSVSSMFGALLNGATCLPFDLLHEGVDRMARWLNDERITIYHSVPILFRQLFAHEPRFPRLRVIRLEGDRATKREVELYQRHFGPECVLVNGLGATECGLVRQFFIDPQTQIETDTVPIGYPVEDMEVLVVDETGREVITGSTGEIIVRSVYLATGYWRQPELTAERFVSDADGSGVRLYRTGDLGRMSDDGLLECLGRKDHQVKVGGQTVEPAAVEAALLALPGVGDAAVVARQDPPDHTRLVAYVVTAKQPAPTVSALRRELAQTLPDHMIPPAYVLLDRLPRNANGKVDRAALPAPDHHRPRLDAEYAAPTSTTTQQLAELWTRVLGIDRVGVDDDFFELGGDSLAATELLAAISKQRDVELPLLRFLERPTIAGIAEWCDRNAGIRRQAATGEIPLVRIHAGSNGAAVFLMGGEDNDLWGLAAMARHFDPDRPVFGLQTPGISVSRPAYAVEDLARWSVEQVRRVQPRGPHHLIGHCFGGWVMFETARQLQQQGERVGLLVMMECFRKLHPDRHALHNVVAQRMNLWRRLGYHTRAMGRHEGGRLAYVTRRAAAFTRSFAADLGQSGYNLTIRRGWRLPRVLQQTRYACRRASSFYDPQAYDGPALLVQVHNDIEADPPRPPRAPALSVWGKLFTGPVEELHIPEDRARMWFDPSVRTLGESINAHMMASV